jgi:hypothetical protein
MEVNHLVAEFWAEKERTLKKDQPQKALDPKE